MGVGVGVGSTRRATDLKPEEEPLGAGLELQHVHPPRGALVHPLELAVIGEDDEVLHTKTQNNNY